MSNMLIKLVTTFINLLILSSVSVVLTVVTNSDVSCRVLPKACRKWVGHFYLNSRTLSNTAVTNPPPNVPILTECVTLRNIMTSAAEDKAGTLRQNAIAIMPLLVIPNELQYPQNVMHIKTYNDTARGFLTSTIHKNFPPKVWDV